MNKAELINNLKNIEKQVAKKSKSFDDGVRAIKHAVKEIHPKNADIVSKDILNRNNIYTTSGAYSELERMSVEDRDDPDQADADNIAQQDFAYYDGKYAPADDPENSDDWSGHMGDAIYDTVELIKKPSCFDEEAVDNQLGNKVTSLKDNAKDSINWDDIDDAIKQLKTLKRFYDKHPDLQA